MDFHLTTEHEKIREISRKLATDFATRTAQHDQESSLPVENYAALKREGFYGLTVPKRLGGWEAGFLGWTIAAEELGFATK
jgi:alkylation response protein AidB-like acyl-CoA dehydrogenase